METIFNWLKGSIKGAIALSLLTTATAASSKEVDYSDITPLSQEVDVDTAGESRKVIANNAGMAWVVVSDIEKSIEYYTTCLGLVQDHYVKDYGWAELSNPNGGVRIGLAQYRAGEPLSPGGNGVIVISVNDIEKAISDYSAQGVIFKGDLIEIPGHVKLQLGVDLDGNHFQLAQMLN